MHIQIELRGYREEKPQMEEARRLLQDFLDHHIVDPLMDIIGLENLGDEEEFMDWGFDVHYYERPEDEEERYWVG